MIVKELYYYERETDKFTVSIDKPDCEYALRYRLIADEDKKITKDGVNFTTCIDVESTDGWYEISDSQSLESDEISADEFMALVEEAL